MIGSRRATLTRTHQRSLTLGLTLTACAALLSIACDEEKPAPAPAAKKLEQKPAPEPDPPSPPHLIISESGPSVRGMSVMVNEKTGLIPPPELAKLKNYLNDEKEFIDGKELSLLIDRKAKQGWVTPYLAALGDLGVKKVTVKTETRTEYPAELEFVPVSEMKKAAPCSLVGSITDDGGTAIWRLKGGTARKRGRGLGGPDLSMTAEIVTSMAKSCDSDLFVVTGAKNENVWGLIYDLAASGVANEKAKLKRAGLAPDLVVIGRKVEF